MKDFDVKASLEAALTGTDELSLPASLASDWEPMECLGHSEYCETFLLRGRKNGDKAVLKLVKGRSPDAGLAEKLRSLSHPGLPKILSAFVEGDHFIILREYIEGATLSDTARVFTPDETVRVALQLCDALSYLHGLTPPLIHRDVKPENILMRPDGTVVLIDFGIARLYSKTEEKDTRVMGTEFFAPPEQYGFRQTDSRSDLYALGMVMGWMLTGSVRADDYAAIADKRLRKIVAKCAAFSPEERFASAAEVRKALRNLRGPRRAPIWIAACVSVAVIVCAICLFLPRSKPILFTEPLIERAVRTSLGVSEDTPLSADQLALIEGIYIFGDAISSDPDGFYTAAGNWYAGDTKARGPVTRLTDLRQLPNLRRVMIAANHITDLSPLSELALLETVEFKHNSITDIAPLKDHPSLVSVGLNDNPFTDLTPLLSLPDLRYLDLCDASSYDPAPIADLGDFDCLNISNRTASWRVLGARSVRDLRLGWTGIDSLDAVAAVSALEHLEIEHTAITVLDGIELHPDLTYLRMSGCAVSDLSPLLRLPKLQTLVIDGDRRCDVEALGAITFTVEYE